MTAIQVQQSWAYTNNVNLLAAGASSPSHGSTGSGIYSGKFGALKSVLSAIPTTKVLIADLPRTPGLFVEAPAQNSEASLRSNENVFDLSILKLTREELNKYNLVQLNFGENSTQKGTICSNKLCCTYDINVAIRPLIAIEVSELNMIPSSSKQKD